MSLLRQISSHGRSVGEEANRLPHDRLPQFPAGAEIPLKPLSLRPAAVLGSKGILFDGTFTVFVIMVAQPARRGTPWCAFTNRFGMPFRRSFPAPYGPDPSSD